MMKEVGNWVVRCLDLIVGNMNNSEVEDKALGDFAAITAMAETKENIDKQETKSSYDEEGIDTKLESGIRDESIRHVDGCLESIESTKVTNVEEKAFVPSVIELHATAYFENSPYDRLTEEDFQSLGKFVTNSDHLQQNVHKVVIDSQSSYQENTGTLTHTAKLRIYVLTERLWETPRSYIWKHVGGDNCWVKGNGTKVTLRRIHQKD